jgi:hypothetical protein
MSMNMKPVCQGRREMSDNKAKQTAIAASVMTVIERSVKDMETALKCDPEVTGDWLSSVLYTLDIEWV